MRQPKDIRIGDRTLADVLDEHARWLHNEGGKRANLMHANLMHADLRRANLMHANLMHADLRRANLMHANLTHADLRRANLTHADLRRAHLRGCIGNSLEIHTVQTDRWPVTYTATVMQIGCQRHYIDEWWDFDDRYIDSMDAVALGWWRIWKPILRQIIAAAPATPTGHED